MTDRDSIFDYTALVSPRAAIALDERIRGQVQQLADFPYSGRGGSLPCTRELVVQGTPYIAVYGIEEDVVLVLRVIHSARQWPERL